MTKESNTSISAAPEPVTFTELGNTDFISKCQGMLPNRMQCTRAGKFLASNGLQYCGAHALHIQAGLMQTPIVPLTATGTVEAQPIKQEFRTQTPTGETLDVVVTETPSGEAATPNEGAKINEQPASTSGSTFVSTTPSTT